MLHIFKNKKIVIHHSFYSSFLDILYFERFNFNKEQKNQKTYKNDRKKKKICQNIRKTKVRILKAD